MNDFSEIHKTIYFRRNRKEVVNGIERLSCIEQLCHAKVELSSVSVVLPELMGIFAVDVYK